VFVHEPFLPELVLIVSNNCFSANIRISLMFVKMMAKGMRIDPKPLIVQLQSYTLFL